MGEGFLRRQKGRSAMYALGTERQCSNQTGARGEAAGAHNGNTNSPGDLGQQHKRRDRATHMSARLHTLSNDCIGASGLGGTSVLNRPDLIKHPATRLARLCNRVGMYVPEENHGMNPRFETDGEFLVN